MPTTDKRLSILSDIEAQELFGLPRFNDDDRDVYFSLDPDESLIFESLRFVSTRLLFLLQCQNLPQQFSEGLFFRAPPFRQQKR